jgi:hypothetical protein
LRDKKLIEKTDDDYRTKNAIRRLASEIAMHINPDMKMEKIRFDADDVTYCNGCHCATHSIRKSKLVFLCGKCGYDKTMGDVLQNQGKKDSGKE